MQQEPTIPQNPSTPSSQPTPKKSRTKEGWRSVASTILILIIAPIIALSLTSFVFQSYEVDGDSMESTLQNQDRLIIWKVPRTIARVTNHDFIPKRGTVIVFVKHDVPEAGTSEDKQLIKRVVGLPGDRVVVEDGKVTIYNKDHAEGFNPDKDGGYPPLDITTDGNVDVVVPEGEVFVMGDNRGNSLDSRLFSTVPADDIVGELALRIFPVNKAKSF